MGAARLKAKVFVAMPAFGGIVQAQTTSSLVALTRELTDAGIFGGFSTLSFPCIEDLRNVFLSVWFDALDATHLLFIDADMSWEPSLIFDMLKADKELIGAIYPAKRLPISFVGSPLEPPAEPEGNLLEVEGLGCGVMLIRRDAIQRIIDAGEATVTTDLRGTALAGLLEPHGVKRLIRAFDKLVTPDGRNLSEDFSYCFRHRAAAGKVWAWINARVTHLGTFAFSANYADLYRAK